MAILDSHTFAAETPEPSERQTTPLPQENATQGETAAKTGKGLRNESSALCFFVRKPVGLDDFFSVLWRYINKQL